MNYRLTVMLLVFSLLTTAGCLKLVVNVNFPESAVQQATDTYVHDLYKQKEKGKPAKPDSTKPPLKSSFALIPSAYAVEEEVSAQFQINSPKAMKIREKLAENLTEVLDQKKAGIFGETNDGKLVIRSPEKLKPILKVKIEKVVTEENKARDELYAEVLQINHVAQNRLKDVKKSFARSFQAESPPGTWVQDESGTWTQK